jgi:hypothetical protein
VVDSEEQLRGLQNKSGNQPYMNEPRGYRGVQRGSVKVQVHPDWRAQLLLEQVRDWLNELKTAEDLIINTIRESADLVHWLVTCNGQQLHHHYIRNSY